MASINRWLTPLLALVCIATGAVLYLHRPQDESGHTPPHPPAPALISDPSVGPRLDAITARLDALVKEVAVLSKITALATVPEPVAGFGGDSDEMESRMREELRKKEAMPEKFEIIRRAMDECVRTGVIPDDGDSEGSCIIILLGAQTRVNEVNRRLVPWDREPGDEGPWNRELHAAIATIREWRRTELVKAIGEDRAVRLIATLGNVQHF